MGFETQEEAERFAEHVELALDRQREERLLSKEYVATGLDACHKRIAELEDALREIVAIVDIGVDGTDEHGVFRNWPATERDAMYDVAKKALS